MGIKTVLQRVVVFLFLVILFLYFVFFYYKSQREEEAQAFIYPSVVEFENGDFSKALYGSEFSPGFYGYMLKYYDTHAGNTSRIYAGICFIKLAQYEVGIKCLLSAKVDDDIIHSKVLSFLGDAYMCMKDYDNALVSYLSAASKNDNDIDTPLFLFKAVFAYEMLRQYDHALSLLERILSKYKNSENYGEFLEEKKVLDFIVKNKNKIKS